MPKGLPHQDKKIVHLKAKPGVHFDIIELKHRKVHLLFTRHGAHNTGGRVPEVVCGTTSWFHRTTVAARVTCSHCRRMIDTPPANPRSGMRMPRPPQPT